MAHLVEEELGTRGLHPARAGDRANGCRRPPAAPTRWPLRRAGSPVSRWPGHRSPLLVVRARDGLMAASDVLGLDGEATVIHELADGDVVTLGPGGRLGWFDARGLPSRRRYRSTCGP